MDAFKDLLSHVYSPQKADHIISELSLHEATPNPTHPTWHKNMYAYSVYPFSFCEDDHCALKQLTERLDYLTALGINAIHVLPPFASPLIDNGFDVSDYYTIDEKYGGNKAFQSFLKEAQKRNMHVFIDFILNHISDQHPWFQKAIHGDAYYRDFFVWSETPPEYIETIDKETGVYARYTIDGQEKDIRLIFPEQAGPIPHWRQAKDGIWYLHTFYPQQIDLNWFNPNVFVEMANIITYWGKQNVSFRLDAVRHIGKKWEDGLKTGTKENQIIVRALHKVLTKTCPDSVFLIEANIDLPDLITYCGTEDKPAAELAYNFPLNEALWTTLMLQDATFLWEIIDESMHLPNWAQWITFLRNHDAVTLWYCTPKTKDKLCANLVPRGKAFMGTHAIAGRTASFLNNTVEQISMAHFLLLSLPGSPCIIYGDEIGKPNDEAYMHEQTVLKRKRIKGAPITDDARDINRGYITDEQVNSKTGTQIYQAIQEMVEVRSRIPKIAQTYPTRINAGKDIFAARYDFGDSHMDVYINLGKTPKTITVDTYTETLLAINKATVEADQLILPAYAGVWLKQ